MMKKVCMTLSKYLKTVFGYGIMIVLFAGGLTFFGYVAALIVGGGNTFTCPTCDTVVNLSAEAQTTAPTEVITVEVEGEDGKTEQEDKTVCAFCKKDISEGAAMCTKCNACPSCGETMSPGAGAVIARVISKTIMPWIIVVSTALVLIGLLAMDLAGEQARTPEKKKAVKHEGEM